MKAVRIPLIVINPDILEHPRNSSLITMLQTDREKHSLVSVRCNLERRNSLTYPSLKVSWYGSATVNQTQAHLQ